MQCPLTFHVRRYTQYVVHIAVFLLVSACVTVVCFYSNSQPQ